MRSTISAGIGAFVSTCLANRAKTAGAHAHSSSSWDGASTKSHSVEMPAKVDVGARVGQQVVQPGGRIRGNT